MKTKPLTLVVLIFLMIPLSAFAFSWKNLLWWQETKPEATKTQVIQKQKQITAQEKLANWEKLYKTKDWQKILKESNNFTFTEQEINYLLAQKIKQEKNPPILNPEIDLKKDVISISGYLQTPLKGNIKADIEVNTQNNEIELKVKKLKFKGIPIPKSFADKLISKNINPLLEFLETYPNYEGINIKIENNQINLDYK